MAFLILKLFIICIGFTVIAEGKYVEVRLQESADVAPEISNACQASLFPDDCKSSLMISSVATKRGAGAVEIIKAAMGLSSDGVTHCYHLSEAILSIALATANFNMTVAARNCLETLSAAIATISRSIAAPLQMTVKDAQNWISASLTYQYGCYSAFHGLNSTRLVRNTADQMNGVMKITSTALGMLDALNTYGHNMKSWRPPQTERSKNFSTRFPDHQQSQDLLDVLLNVGELPVPNITVSKVEGELESEQYSSTIQAAVDNAPDYSAQRFIIYIKAGVYKEIVRIPPSKTNLMFVGDGMDRTIVTGSLSAQIPGVGTHGSATVGVNADGFVARDIAFENTAGPEMHQAVALRVDSDLSAFERCAFLGHQDTLYAHALRQFYRNCRIEGNVDFIFGNAAAIFHNCSILVRPRQVPSNLSETNPIAAHGRLDPGQTTGFVFENCSIDGTEEYMAEFYGNPKMHKAYLGRPWKAYSRTIFMRSYMGPVIQPDGWLPWDGTFALDTLYYGEFENFGPGAGNVSARVPWSSEIPPGAVGMYSIQNFIEGDLWLPQIHM